MAFRNSLLTRDGRSLLRAVTLNFWGENGPWRERLDFAASELNALDVDLVALQEVRERTFEVPNQAALLAEKLGFEYAFANATEWGGGLEGLAILSRFPLQRQRAVTLPHASAAERRILLSAVVQTPVAQVGVHTTHLTYRMTDGEKRKDQIAALHRFIRVYEPEGDHPQLLLGDFNAKPDTDEIRFLKGQYAIDGERAYYQDSWEIAATRGDAVDTRGHAATVGATWSRENHYTAPLGWLERDRRIDYIFVGQERKDGRGRVVRAEIVCASPKQIEGQTDPVWPSDHFGLMVEMVVGSSSS